MYTVKDIVNKRTWLKSHALKMLRNEDDAEDAVQLTLFKAIKNINNFQNKSKLSTWLYTILRNNCYDKIRKSKNEIFIDFNDKENEKILKDYEVPKQTFNEIDTEQLEEYVQTALNKLTPNFKDLLLLFYYQNKTYEDISNIKNIPIGTVKSQLYRAKQKLKNFLIELGENQHEENFVS